jgi:hypothetical protein
LDFKEFTYDLQYALSSDDFRHPETAEGIQKQTAVRDALRPLFKYSWIEDDFQTYLEPGERTRYSFLASLPPDATMVLLLCDFTDDKNHVESVRKSYVVPKGAGADLPVNKLRFR